MSLSLLTRRLSGLRLASRATAQLFPQLNVTTSSPAITSPPAISPSRPLILHHPFSSAPSSEVPINNNNNNDDDGGPLSLSTMTNDELAEFSTIPGYHLITNPPRTTPRGALVGTVISDKMQKTVNVAVDRYRVVPKYRKRLRFTRKFMAHDEMEVCNVGDLVMIVPCQKISRHKHFMVREIIRAKGQL